MIETKTNFHGDKISEFKSIELQGFVTCFCCGVRQGPFPIKKPPFPKNPRFDCLEEKQLVSDAGLFRAVLSGSVDEDDPIVKWVCWGCVAKHGLQILDD